MPIFREAGVERSRPLAMLPAGTRGVIISIPRDDPGLTADLAALRMLPGEAVEVVEVIPFGGPLLVRAGGSLYAVSRALAGGVAVCEA